MFVVFELVDELFDSVVFLARVQFHVILIRQYLAVIGDRCIHKFGNSKVEIMGE